MTPALQWAFGSTERDFSKWLPTVAIGLLVANPASASWAGEIRWARVLGGGDKGAARTVTMDRTGNVLVAGRFVSIAPRNTRNESTVFLAKFNRAGEMLWSAQASGPGTITARSVAVDERGDCVVAGDFTGTIAWGEGPAGSKLVSSGASDVFIAKFNADAKLVWARAAGGSGEDFGHAVAADENGGVAVTGSYEFSGTFGSVVLPGRKATQLFVANFDSAGRTLWARDIGGGESAVGLALALDRGGNVHVTGKYHSGTVTFSDSDHEGVPAVDTGFFLAKYDSLGRLLSYRSENGRFPEAGLGVAIDPEQKVVVAGTFEEEMKLGNTHLRHGPGQGMFIARLDAPSEVLWAITPGGAHAGAAQGVNVDAAGRIFLTGHFNGTLLLGGTTLFSANARSLFLAQFDSNGNARWATTIGGSDEVAGLAVAADTTGAAFCAGLLKGQAVFDETILQSQTGSDAFLARFEAPPARPMINLSRGALGLVADWPLWATNFTLESTTRLDLEGTWRTAPFSPATSSRPFTHTNAARAPVEFFRLRQLEPTAN